MESVILSSKPTSQFPNNHGGDFRNAINHPLNVQYKPGQQFKVALAELFYVPGSWSNVRAGANYVDIQVKNYPVYEYAHITIYYHEFILLNASVQQRFASGTIANFIWMDWPRAEPPGPNVEFLRFSRLIDDQPAGQYKFKVFDSVEIG